MSIRQSVQAGLRATAIDQRLPIWLQSTALILNVALIVLELGYLVPRWVGPNEVAVVSFLVAAPILNLAMFADYHRRGLFLPLRGASWKERGDSRPLPTPLRWLVCAFNILLLFNEALIYLEWGGIAQGLLQWSIASLHILTPIVSLTVFLDYNRRRV
ncbi:MAG: hypothetical protein ABL986_13205 [Vicinamibacterales bacterium]